MVGLNWWERGEKKTETLYYDKELDGGGPCTSMRLWENGRQWCAAFYVERHRHSKNSTWSYIYMFPSNTNARTARKLAEVVKDLLRAAGEWKETSDA